MVLSFQRSPRIDVPSDVRPLVTRAPERFALLGAFARRCAPVR